MRKIEDINIWAFNPNDDVVKELKKLPQEQLEDLVRESFKEKVLVSLYLNRNQNVIMEMSLYQAIKTHLWLRVEPLTYDVALKRYHQDMNKPFFYNLDEMFPDSLKSQFLKEDLVFFEFNEITMSGDNNDVKSYFLNDNICCDKMPWNKFFKHLVKNGEFSRKIISNKTINLQQSLVMAPQKNANEIKDRIGISQTTSANYLKCFEGIYKTTQDVFPDIKNMAVYLTDRLKGCLTNVDEPVLREEDNKKLLEFQSNFIAKANIEDVKHLNDMEALFSAESPIARALMNKILQDNMI